MIKKTSFFILALAFFIIVPQAVFGERLYLEENAGKFVEVACDAGDPTGIKGIGGCGDDMQTVTPGGAQFSPPLPSNQQPPLAERLKQLREKYEKIIVEEERKRQERERKNKLPTFTVDLKSPSRNDAERSALNLAKEPNQPHENIHGVNSLARIRNQGKKGTGLQVGFDKNGNAVMVWMNEPKGTIGGIDRYIPPFMKDKNSGSAYETYIVEGKKQWNDRVTYLFDEWSAYILGTDAYIKMVQTGKGNPNLLSAERTVDFMVIGSAVAQYLKQNDPVYFKSNEFQSLLKLFLERSAQEMEKAMDATNPSGGQPFRERSASQVNKMNQFKNSSQASEIRKTLTGLYGKKWAKDILGFEE